MNAYIGIPRLSGSGGTFGYTKFSVGKIKDLLKIKPFGKEQFDCYGIKHTVKIFQDDDSYNSSYWFDEEKGKWIKSKKISYGRPAV